MGHFAMLKYRVKHTVTVQDIELLAVWCRIMPTGIIEILGGLEHFLFPIIYGIILPID